MNTPDNLSVVDSISADASEMRFYELAYLGRNQWWRYLIAVGFISAMTLVGGVLIFRIVDFWCPACNVTLELDDWRQAELTTALLEYVLSMLVLALVLFASLLVAPLFHRRSWRSLVTAHARVRWSRILTSFSVAFLLYLLALATQFVLFPDSVDYVLSPFEYLVFLPFTLILVPLQVLGEEVLFRGYVLQLVGRLTHRKWIIFIVPALLFWAAHLPNEEVQLGGIWVVLDFAAIALYLSILVMKGNGLEHAIGMHLGINMFLFAVAGYEEFWYPTPTIFSNLDANFAIGFAVSLVIYALHYCFVFNILPALSARRSIT